MIFATANQVREAFGEELWAAINRHIDLNGIDWEPVEWYEGEDFPWYESCLHQDPAEPLLAMLPLFGALFYRIIALRDLNDVWLEVRDMAVVVEGATKRAAKNPGEETAINLVLIALLIQALVSVCENSQEPCLTRDDLFEIHLETTDITRNCLLAAAQL